MAGPVHCDDRASSRPTRISCVLFADADSVCGAASGTRDPGRVNSRNGYRHRELETRVGRLNVAVSKLRESARARISRTGCSNATARRRRVPPPPCTPSTTGPGGREAALGTRISLSLDHVEHALAEGSVCGARPGRRGTDLRHLVSQYKPGRVTSRRTSTRRPRPGSARSPSTQRLPRLDRRRPGRPSGETRPQGSGDHAAFGMASSCSRASVSGGTSWRWKVPVV